MNIYTYDCEVYKYDYIVVCKNYATGRYTVTHNDKTALEALISPESVFFGFNSKSYDQYIIKAIMADFEPQVVKKVNDWIIQGKQGYQCPALKGVFCDFNNVDLRDDMQQTLSLKSIEGHLGMSIEETEVPFNIDRPLTEKELQLVIKYCKHDVDATEQLLKLRKDYIKTKANLGSRAGIDSIQAMGLTNAKLTAKMLRATYQERHDGRLYEYPQNLDKRHIPEEVLQFFDQIRDESIPDEDLFSRSLDIEIGGMPCRYAWGGVHGSLTGYRFEASETRVMQNRDVSSLYPSLIEQYGYLSRNVPDPELFYAIRRDRIAAKHNGDKQTAKDLKLPLNTVSGAQENKYNELYDPLPTRSLRISGQLFLTVLLMRLLERCKTLTPVNLNTDGLAYEVDKSELPIVDRICSEWEAETRFELETDEIQQIWIKDVNNLLLVKTDGSVKTVGGYLNYGITEKGAWGINNNYTIVKKALREYMVNGTPIRETIEQCDDPFQFQIIAHASSKYESVFQECYGERQPRQKTNRVYASKDPNLGTLFKVKPGGQTAKMPNLPEHCVIDNDNRITVNEIDKEWYIRLAEKMMNYFRGERKMPKKKEDEQITMITEEPTEDIRKMNVYEKLMRVRAEFAAGGVKKTGKNIQQQWLYFELTDIIPAATPLFLKYRLFPMTNFSTEFASMGIINMDDPEDMVCFTIPMREIEPIINKQGQPVNNAVQRLGSVVTYQRRYLYMIALDIVEQDAIDSGILAPKEAPEELPAPPAPKAPVTVEERKEIKQELTSGMASDLQVKQLKKMFKKLIEAYPDKTDIVSEIMIATENLTQMTKEECETTIKGIAEMLGENK